MKQILAFFWLLFLCSTSVAQVAINNSGAAPHGSAMLDVSSDSGGLLPPRLSTTERDNISSPANGLMIFNTTSNCLEVRIGPSWKSVTCGCIAAPDAVVALSASGVDITEFTANWSAVSGAEEYLVDVATDAGFASLVSGFNGASAGTSTSLLVNGLTASTNYYYRVRAVNECGAGLNSEAIEVTTDDPPFICGVNSFTDPRDGNVYPTGQYGSQCWMTKNLAYLPSVVGVTTGSTSTPYYYVHSYDGTNVASAKATSNYSTYGALYNYEAAITACPSGWHLGSDAEWRTLEEFHGMCGGSGGGCSGAYGDRGTNQGTQMKSTTGWNSGAGTNSTGFNILASGNRRADPTVWQYIGDYGYQRTATSLNADDAIVRMFYSSASIYRSGVGEAFFSKASGFAVRCVRD